MPSGISGAFVWTLEVYPPYLDGTYRMTLDPMANDHPLIQLQAIGVRSRTKSVNPNVMLASLSSVYADTVIPRVLTWHGKRPDTKDIQTVKICLR